MLLVAYCVSFPVDMEVDVLVFIVVFAVVHACCASVYVEITFEPPSISTMEHWFL